MFDIITVGSATRDVFMFTEALHPHRAKDTISNTEACLPLGSKINVEKIHYDTGGGATNAAATFTRLGKFKVAALTSLGNDIRGRSIMNVLKENHVNTSLIQLHPKESTAYSVILSPSKEGGERTILTYRGASAHLNAQKIPWNNLTARWFYITSLGGELDLIQKIINYAKRQGASVAFNPGGQEISKRKKCIALCADVDILILNHEEACQLVHKPFENTHALLRALALISPTAVMTDGPKGAYAVVSSQSSVHSSQRKTKTTSYVLHPTYSAYYVPSASHKAKNQTGAGDAFGSGFVTGWIKSHGNIREALRVGSLNADSVVQHIGAKVGILNKYPSKSTRARLPIKTLPL